MHASRSIVPSERLAEFCLEPRTQATSQESTIATDQFRLLATGLVELLETARRELEGDREVAKTSLNHAKAGSDDSVAGRDLRFIPQIW
jgi:hypothetical protein